MQILYRCCKINRGVPSAYLVKNFVFFAIFALKHMGSWKPKSTLGVKKDGIIRAEFKAFAKQSGRYHQSKSGLQIISWILKSKND